MSHRSHARTPASRKPTERPILVLGDRSSIVHCKRCGAKLTDCEPFGSAQQGEFWHPKPSDCPNAGKRLGPEESTVHQSKAGRRARDRGARLAAKHRPK